MTAPAVPAAAAEPAPEPEAPKEPAAPAAADQGDEGKPAEPEAPKEPEPSATDDKDKDELLGPQGRKALDAWKSRAKEAEAADRAKDTAIAELTAKLADVGLPEAEQALAAARREGESTATATVTAAATKALAAQALITEAKGRLADPSDVTAFLDASDIKVGDGFAVDAAAIAALVDDLLARKPHLAVKAPGQAGPVVPAGSIGQGVRSKESPSLHDRAALALSEGDAKSSVGFKAQELFLLQAARKASGA